MFFDAATRDHGLPHDPFKAIVAPRPIGWIGTKGKDGTLNLAPYSFFNAISDRPKMVMFSSSGYKDSARNCEETGVFTANLVGASLVEAMNESSAAVPYDADEFALSGLTPVSGRMVDAPYVGEAPAVLECRVTEIMRPKDIDGREIDNWVVFGQVLGIHIYDAMITDGRLDMTKVGHAARLGYMDYANLEKTYELKRPVR